MSSWINKKKSTQDMSQKLQQTIGKEKKSQKHQRKRADYFQRSKSWINS